MRMRMTTSDEHSIVTMLRSIRIIFSTYSFNATYSRTYVLPTAYNHTFVSAHAYSTCTSYRYVLYVYLYCVYHGICASKRNDALASELSIFSTKKPDYKLFPVLR